MTPRTTVRLQLNSNRTLDDVRRDLPYYDQLGISHLYLSPVTCSRSGSTHGYDVIDYSAVDPDLGGESALRRLACDALERDMGIVLDIVPNHMAAHPENPWWRSVLQNGRGSAFADWLDIDWKPPQPWLRNKILLPILPAGYRQALASGDIRLVHNVSDGLFVIEVSGQQLPLMPGSLDMAAWPDVPACLAAHDACGPDGRAALHALLDRQHYRLAWWRSAATSINWRRFFEVSELIGVRVENDAVFDAVHALPLRLFSQGLIDGLRVDHVDGMAWPLQYCHRLHEALRARAAQRPAKTQQRTPWLVVEKILAPGEVLDERWDVHGDSGYAFMDAVSAVMHDTQGEDALTGQWAQIASNSGGAHAWLYDARKQMVDAHFVAERDRLVHALVQAIAPEQGGAPHALGRAVDALLVAFPVYRVYARPGGAATQDHQFLDAAHDDARARLLADDDDEAIRWLQQVTSVLAGEAATPDDMETLPSDGATVPANDAAMAMQRFQQLTPPLAAKAQEDTIFYRYGRLLSRNEVGSEPGVFSMSPQAFYDFVSQRAYTAPSAMLATATHDHKRGEDARARLAVVSETGAAWKGFSDSVMTAMQAIRREGHTHERAFRYMMLQTLVGAWPPGVTADDHAALQALYERMSQWLIKAMREGKQISSWLCPDTAAEDALLDLLKFILVGHDGHTVRACIADWVNYVSPAGVVNSLAFLVLRCTMPGVPDLYQGTELWDFSLVDPDNRRPPDMGLRRDTLERVVQADQGGMANLLGQWHDGAVKMAVLARCLGLRRDCPGLFGQGACMAISTDGPGANNVLALMRCHGDQAVLVVATRCAHDALQDGATPSLPHIEPAWWHDTALQLPAPFAHHQWVDVLTGGIHAAAGSRLHVGAVLGTLPVAVLRAAPTMEAGRLVPATESGVQAADFARFENAGAGSDERRRAQADAMLGSRR